MNELEKNRHDRQVSNWLLLGVVMIMVQVVLGGITRLTESGLSITEWNPITGALPPLNETSWQIEFEKYKGTDQFKYIHQQFSLSDFKFIFFWEWFHRLWARMMGMVFLIGFVYFLITRRFKKNAVIPMAMLFLLGALQGAIGWIMVKSGLVPEKYFVGHIELTTHLMAALGLLCYTLWFALSLRIDNQQKTYNSFAKNGLISILVVLLIQLMYGGFMAGMKAAVVAPTWPDINGAVLPLQATELSPFLKNIFFNPLMVQFIHRSVAYLLLALSIYWWIKSARVGNELFQKLRNLFFLLILLQVALGIVTVINSTYANRLVWLGVSHQFVAMLLLANVTTLLFVVRKSGSLKLA